MRPHGIQVTDHQYMIQVYDAVSWYVDAAGSLHLYTRDDHGRSLRTTSLANGMWFKVCYNYEGKP